MAVEQSAGDKIAGGPPPTDDTGATKKPNPIGVPAETYNPATGQYEPWQATVSVAPRAPSVPAHGFIHAYDSGVPVGTTSQVPPRYYGGDEVAPAGWDPERIANLQRDLVAVGLIPKSASIRVGFWDANSQKAFEQLLGYANQTGTTWQSALSNYGQMTEAEGAGQPRAPLQVRTSNPDELRTVFRKAVIDTLGQGWDQTKIDSMVSAYQAAETGAQTTAYNQAETGGTVSQVASPDVFAATQARAENPLLAQEHDVLTGPIESFKQMLAGWQ